MTRNRLYLLLFAALTAGYLYLAWAFKFGIVHNNFTPCLFKNATGIACPSCGTTRSVLLLANGNITGAALLNPLGFIVAAIMLVGPFWLLYDVLLKKDTLHKGYIKFEKTLQIKWVAIPLVLLLLANWIWNIYKGL